MTQASVLRQLWNSPVGKAGLVLFGLLVLVALWVVLNYPLSFGPQRWSNPAVWGDYPKNAPPAWTNFAGKRAVHRVLEMRQSVVEGQTQIYRAPFVVQALPSFVSFSLSQAEFQGRPPSIEVVLQRPDEGKVTLYRTVLSGPLSGERPPYKRHFEEPYRVLLSSEPEVGDALTDFLEQKYGTNLPYEDIQRQPLNAMFGLPRDGFIEPLGGNYQVEVRVSTADPADKIGLTRFVLGGAVYGAMGTDGQGRDLIQGLLFGLPVALIIGIVVSLVSTILGTSIGLISGYVGGLTDTLIQRAADVVNNVPTLPLLIFLIFILGSKLWLILLILTVFSWPGLAIYVRSMVLSLRSSQEVEAARTLGASRLHIILRHVFPHVAPFIYAQMIFSVPGAILAEAGLSFLGLGDPSLPTWGQILEQGFRTGAVFLGYWWWVIPPGILLVITALAFMLISLAMEPIVNPRLRREG
jgi:peptide/nickel transport system permease protein